MFATYRRKSWYIEYTNIKTCILICRNEGDMDYRKLNTKAMTCMYVKTWIGSVIWIVLLIVSNILLKDEIPTIVSGVIYGVVAMIAIYSLIAPKLRYERYRFLLSEEEFAVRKGLIVVKTEIVPIERLHKIEVSSGPVFRAFGLKEIKVTTAGGEINVSYLDNEIADKIAEHLKTRINTIAVEERNAELEEKQEETVTVLDEMYMEGENGAE